MDPFGHIYLIREKSQEQLSILLKIDIFLRNKCSIAIKKSTKPSNFIMIHHNILPLT